MKLRLLAPVIVVVMYLAVLAITSTDQSLSAAAQHLIAAIMAISLSLAVAGVVIWSSRSRDRPADARYRDLVENAVDMIYTLDCEGRLSFVSTPLMKALGYTRAELLGEPATTIIDPADHPRTAAAFQARLRGERVDPYEFNLLGRDGARLPVEITSNVIHHPDGRPAGTQAILRDMTSCRRAEGALREAHEKLGEVLSSEREQRARTDEILRSLAERTARHTGDQFFRALVEQLSRALHVRYALVCEMVESDPTSMQTLAFWCGDALAPDVRFPLAGTSCEVTLENGEYHCPRGLGEKFSFGPELAAITAESYLGARLVDSTGATVGTLCVLDTSPCEADTRALAVLRVFAGRASAELERVRSERQLRLAQVTIEHGADSVFWVRPDASFSYVNQTACEELGYTREELLTMSVGDIDPDYCEADWPEKFRGIKAVGSRTWEGRHRLRSGEIIPAEITASYVEHGGYEFLCAYCRDLSDRRRAERERRSLQEQLAHVTRVQTVGEIAAGIAHELNQPLTAATSYLGGCIRRIESGEGTLADIVPTLERAAVQSRRAGAIAHKIGDLVRKRAVRIRPESFADIIAEIQDLLQMQARAHSASITIDLPGDLPVIYVDRIQIQQVLLNLASNAFEAMSSTADLPRLAAITAVASGPEEIAVSVRDSGGGVSEAEADAIFNAFYTTKEEGIGMGLPISRKIVRAHGGRLWMADSRSGRTEFTMTLPTAAAQTEVSVQGNVLATTR